MNSGDPIFLTMCKQFGLPAPVCEYQFCIDRKWRFDYSWPDNKTALEVHGGVWKRGRHTRGQGFLNDIEKENRAVVLGWKLVRCTPDTLRTLATIELVRSLLNK